MAVRTDRTRRKATEFVDLVSPNGTEITVSADRAEALMARVPVQKGDGTWHRYAPSGESTEVSKADANKAVVEALSKEKEASK